MSLFELACKMQQNAHAPYSGFKVGAALRSACGQDFGGCNVENAAYPEGICAEAAAIAAMVGAGIRRIDRILIVVDADTVVPPCGGCRQKIAEFAGPDCMIEMQTLQGARAQARLGAMLPGAFGARHLGQD